MSEIQTTSTQPYLIRAWVEWCNDNGLTPYLSVRVDKTVQVPREFVKDGEIVLNISYDATNALKLGNDFIEFTARFGGVPREIMIPVSRVIAIFARETGQGMAMPDEPRSTTSTQAGGVELEQTADTLPGDEPETPDTPPEPPKRGGHLRIVK